MIINQEALNDRANNLGAFNGIRLILVSLHPDTDLTEAHLAVHFYNANELQAIFDDFAADPARAREIFPVTGGHRVRGGPLSGQVQITDIAQDPADDTVLRLTVQPIGDYSTYTLSVNFNNIDPVFGEAAFKFRPGCFNNCPPDWEAPSPRLPAPTIDYLAKDFDSFVHTSIAWMMSRVPGWQPTSEADFDQVLIELFSAAADELSDYQDRVMNEAYLGTARKRVSLARHARLMDYHVHQGNQANTWLALHVTSAHTIPAGFLAWIGSERDASDAAVFMMRETQPVDPLLNDLSLYTWSDTRPALAASSTSADLKLSTPGQSAAEQVRDLVNDGTVRHLLIQEHLNPATGAPPGRDPGQRQLLRLLPDAEALRDPVGDAWFVRVRWDARDQLRANYCFTVECASGKVEDVSLFHGNMVQVHHGRPRYVVFKEPGASLLGSNELHFARTAHDEAICSLPDRYVAYQDTPPGGELPPVSTVAIEVETNGDVDAWDEVISLVHSDDSAERGDHFVVETDEDGRSVVRMGDGVNGRQLPAGAIVHCRYQVGQGRDGNVGADTITGFDQSAFLDVDSVWNPFDVTNGRAPEPVEEIIRRVPEAYRYRQLRAVTLKDYVQRAEELPDVARAAASYRWTGSWRTVRVTVDPVGTTELSDELRDQIANHLEAVRLIGEDLEIRPPRLVPLDITVALCIHPDYWPQDIRYLLEQEFSGGYTQDGRLAFFHPDRWTFGQTLHTSAIIGRVQAIQGVDHVLSVKMKRWGAATPGTPDQIEVRANEIIQVQNDPDHIERGFITFDVQGGRR